MAARALYLETSQALRWGDFGPRALDHGNMSSQEVSLSVGVADLFTTSLQPTHSS